jgi:hypothetical protein
MVPLKGVAVMEALEEIVMLIRLLITELLEELVALDF